MDVSPRALRAVTFREKLRGYHPDDVDQFLERVAEGVAALQGKLDDALARAEKAERESSEASEGEEAVRRTLTLAQRTADLALKEAGEEAARLIAEARDTAQRLADDAQQQLRADLDRLETARRQLHADVLAMQQYVENERVRVRNALADLVRKVDSTTRKSGPPPEPARLDIPPVTVIPTPAPTRRVVEESPPAAPPTPTFVRPAADTAAERTEVEPEVTEPVFDPGVPEPVPVAAEAPEPAEPLEETAAVAREDESEPPARIRREPQPPPVAGTRFAQARPAAGRPAGPPPGPHRLAASMQPPGGEDGEDADADDGGAAGLRRLFGR